MAIQHVLGLVADAQLPDFGDPTTIFSTFVTGAVLGGAYAYARRLPFERAREFGFLGALTGGGAGLLAYLALLLEGVLQ